MSDRRGMILMSLKDLGILLGLPEKHNIVHVNFDPIDHGDMVGITIVGDDMPEFLGRYQVVKRKVIFE